MKDRVTITFQPASDVASLLRKAVRRFPKASQRGARTKFINEAIRLSLATLRGKREGKP